jgi:hypothetical protein
MTAFTIGTWNCRMGIDRKRAAIEDLGCDVLVVPECSSAPGLAKEPGVSFDWKGLDPDKRGLGVFGCRGWRVERAPEATPLGWVLPVRLIDPAGSDAALLLAIWTVRNKAAGWPSYRHQVAATIGTWEKELRSDRVILAGDFNCSAQGPSSAPHLANVSRLDEMGVRSAYHTHHGEQHGEESAMTLRWFGKGRLEYLYHCDFVFLSRAIGHRLQRAEVGTISQWVESRLSDHTPVLAHVGAA